MSKKERSFSIDFFPESPFRYLDHDAIVCLDVIRATSTLVTAIASGRRVFAAADLDQARRIAEDLKDPLLAGGDERQPDNPYEVGNSPSAISSRHDLWRPLVLVSTYGTRLVDNARGGRCVYVASLRNLAATAAAVAERHQTVALLGACSNAGLRCEDELAAARLGVLLKAAGFQPASRTTATTLERWGAADPKLIRLGRSAERLVATGQSADLDFILAHVDDLDFPCQSGGNEVLRVDRKTTRGAAPIERERPERAPVATGTLSATNWRLAAYA